RPFVYEADRAAGRPEKLALQDGQPGAGGSFARTPPPTSTIINIWEPRDREVIERASRAIEKRWPHTGPQKRRVGRVFEAHRCDGGVVCLAALDPRYVAPFPRGV